MMSEHRPLSAAQQRYLTQLVAVLERTHAAATSAQAAANDFVGYCAEEAGVKLGTDGWTFDQTAMAFVQHEDDVPIQQLPAQKKVAERNGAA
jgi:hypothetical protein